MSTFRALRWPSKAHGLDQSRPQPKRKKPKKKAKRHDRYCREKNLCPWGRQFLKKEKKRTWLVLCLDTELCREQTTEPQRIMLEAEQVENNG